MSQNPLQQFFRQPKIFIELPSHGIYSAEGTIQGNVENIPVYGMTGMDEILMKTPDALLTGDSVVKVIESCCPTIKDAWDISSIDFNLILIAIRIATFGDTLLISQVCPACKEDNEYDIKRANLIDYYKSCSYASKLVLKDLTVNTRPLTYKQATDISLKNFQLQQQIKQLESIEDDQKKTEFMAKLFAELGQLQQEIYEYGIESVDIGVSVVTERPFISEWLKNCDRNVMDRIKAHFQTNQTTWANPKQKVQCSECQHEFDAHIEFDEANFFANA